MKARIESSPGPTPVSRSNQPYHSRGCHSLPGLAWTWRIEAWCKVLIPPFAIAAELYLAHCRGDGTCQYRCG